MDSPSSIRWEFLSELAWIHWQYLCIAGFMFCLVWCVCGCVCVCMRVFVHLHAGCLVCRYGCLRWCAWDGLGVYRSCSSCFILLSLLFTALFSSSSSFPLCHDLNN